MLVNITFYLKGTAKAWFDHNGEELISWSICKIQLHELFGQLAGCQCAAKKELSSCVKMSTESYLMHVQDVLALYGKVNAKLTEANTVAHVLKGIADDAFNLIVLKKVFESQ